MAPNSQSQNIRKIRESHQGKIAEPANVEILRGKVSLKTPSKRRIVLRIRKHTQKGRASSRDGSTGVKHLHLGKPGGLHQPKMGVRESGYPSRPKCHVKGHGRL